MLRINSDKSGQTFETNGDNRENRFFFSFRESPKVAWAVQTSVRWGVSQMPPNQKLALRIGMIFQPICENVGCCDKSLRSHIGHENLQFCVVALVALQIGTFEHLATHNTMLQNPYFFCLFCLKSLYISQLCQQCIVIAYLCNNWVFLQNIFAKPH